MTMTYVRTMKLLYPMRIDNTQLARLATRLHDKGMSMVSSWSSFNEIPSDDDYGFKATTKQKVRHWLTLNDERVWSNHAKYEVENVMNSINEISKDITATLESEPYEAKERKWAKPAGNYIWFTGKMDGEMVSPTTISYNNDVTMKVRVHKTWRNQIELSFELEWLAERPKKKDEIESMLVDLPLHDMGRMQAIVESILKTKKFGALVDEPIIDCKFEAKTHTSSECAPDIIAKVRAARKVEKAQ